MITQYLSIFLLPIILFNNLLSQEKTLNTNSLKIVEAYNLLQINPGDSSVQLAYLDSFPQDWSTFLSVFQPEDLLQLYSSSDQYICIIDSLRRSFPRQTGELLINLGIEGEWEADATGQIQRILQKYASDNPSLFSKLLAKKSRSKKKHLITYMADMEAISFCREYQAIIDHLNGIDQKRLAKEFEIARKLRMQQKH